jgi:hypothetical protein
VLLVFDHFVNALLEYLFLFDEVDDYLGYLVVLYIQQPSQQLWLVFEFVGIEVFLRDD